MASMRHGTLRRLRDRRARHRLRSWGTPRAWLRTTVLVVALAAIVGMLILR